MKAKQKEAKVKNKLFFFQCNYEWKINYWLCTKGRNRQKRKDKRENNRHKKKAAQKEIVKKTGRSNNFSAINLF